MPGQTLEFPQGVSVPDQIQASHILLMYSGSLQSTASRSKEEAESEIKQLKKELDGGADFGELARKHSDCPSAKQDGKLGTFARGSTVPEFERPAFALEVGAISDVIETPFGFHIIRRHE
jgi:parvulin-like peptidyl-prolyl isomerase